MIVAIILGGLVYVMCSYVVANEVMDIVGRKGYDDRKSAYFWYTFFFWIVGILLAIALPDKSNENK